jgi:hypothetical protein
MPVNTGMPSSRSSAARVSSVIAFSGEPSSIPEASIALHEILEALRTDRTPAADVRVVRRHVFEALR